jgi:hypothetical protein
LNLTSVHQEFRDTPEYAQHPLFRNARLNKSIFLKHTLRIHEREQMPASPHDRHKGDPSLRHERPHARPASVAS